MVLVHDSAAPAVKAKKVLDAMKADVDTLAHDYLQSYPDRSSYATFALHFKRREMGTIFIGRLSVSELVEFSENLFSYIVSLIYDPKAVLDSIGYVEKEDVQKVEQKGFELAQSITAKKVTRGRQLKVFAIFLLYTLYKLQPKEYPALIRLSVPQARDIHKLIKEELIPDGEVQAYFCLQFLVKSRAFTVTPFEREFNPLAPHRIDVSQMSDGYQAALGVDGLREEIDELLPQHENYLKEMAGIGMNSQADSDLLKKDAQTGKGEEDKQDTSDAHSSGDS